MFGDAPGGVFRRAGDALQIPHYLGDAFQVSQRRHDALLSGRLRWLAACLAFGDHLDGKCQGLLRPVHFQQVCRDTVDHSTASPTFFLRCCRAALSRLEIRTGL
jgi:hypothetical protein